MDTKKILLIVGIVLVLIFLFVKKAKAETNTETVQNILITDYDRVWDYKRENGIWYTRQKANASTGQWLDMKASLPLDNYNLSIARLTAFLATKQS